MSKLEIKTSERSKWIFELSWMLSEINENLKALHETNKADRKIIETINKDIIDIYVKNKNLIDEILSIKNEIRSVLLSNNMNLSTNLQKKGKLIIQKENEIHTNNNQIKILSDKLNDVYTKIENTNNLINEELKNEQKIEQLSHLIGFKETSSNICLNDLIIKPDWLEEFIKSHLDTEISKDILDKVIFFKWDRNTGKHSVIKAIANELNRPIFKIKYDDYFNEEWLFVIFNMITSFLREQREEKNEYIDEYNKTQETINYVKNGTFNKNEIHSIQDLDWNIYDYNLWINKSKSEYLERLNDHANNLKHDINGIGDSCIIYIDDLDRIIQSSIYEKWELLWSIKMVISDIKNEAHDVMLVLAGNNLWTNHNDFKLWIDRVFQFGWIEKNYQKTFEKMLQKKLEKLDIQTNIWTFSLNNLEKNYRNIKFLDKLVKRIIKNYILNKKIITQEIFDLELHNLIEWEKSLNNWISLK
jgi:hypothetical protein